MAQGGEIKLSNFFIFNPGLSKSEGEEEKKILYYYPSNVDKDLQLKNAGLCEALVKFTASFQPDKPCEVFCTEKTKQFFYEPEPGFWMAMTISVNAENTKKKDYIHENVGNAILKSCYRMFFVFYGSFVSLMDGDNAEKLQNEMTDFYETYLKDINFENFNIMDVFQGIQYLPLSREPFLHVQSFINLTETKFPSIQHSAFLYNDHLVWSGIDLSDMQILYQHLVRILLPSFIDPENYQTNTTAVNYGSFVNCPAELMDKFPSAESKVPKVYLKSKNGVKCYNMIVYRAVSATICLFLTESTNLSFNLFKNLEEHLGPRLTSLVSEISEYCVRTGESTTESSTKFIYFNKLNLAIKSSVLEARKTGSKPLPSNITNILSNIQADTSLYCDSGEIILETENGAWIVVKYSNGRELYVLTQKKQNLRDVVAEVKKICNTQLKEIFFLR